MIYRATDIALNGKERPYINCLGYAVSKYGIHFNCIEQPVLSNDVTQETRGPEDSKIVKTGDTFGSAWNDFTYPLIVTNTDNMKVLALGIAGFKGFREGLTQWPLMMAASAMSILPIVIVFVLAQKYFIEGVKTTGLKG